MIKLKTEVVKKHLIEQLKAEAELIYKNSWKPKLQERAFIDGAEALFKLLRLGDVSNSFCSHIMTRNPKEHQENKCRLCKKPYQK